MDFTGKTIAGRYKILSFAGQDRLGVYYNAADLHEDNRPVELCFFHSDTLSKRPEDIIRFKAVIRSLFQISHEGILAHFDTGDFFDSLYRVTQVRSGKPLGASIEGSALPFKTAAAILANIARALDHAHSGNILHRFLNPSTVLLDGEKIILTGFGIAHVLEFSNPTVQEDISEYLAFMSPEQCGVLKRAIDERSDLYSAGVLFYRLLTGTLPFTGDSFFTLTHRQMIGSPEAPSALNPDIPRVLDQIVMKLLEREPSNRYQSAGGLILDLDSFLAGSMDFEPGAGDRPPRPVFRSVMVGRDNELEELKRSYEKTMSGNGAITLITGAAGLGKSRLVEELKEHILRRGGVFIGGKCRKEEMNHPYRPFREMLEAYAKDLEGGDEHRRTRVEESLRKEFASLGKLLTDLSPALSGILGDCPPPEDLVPESGITRFLMVLGRFFLRLAALEGGLTIFIDDLQWADADSRHLIEEMLPALLRSPVLLLCTHRDEDTSETPDFITRLQVNPSCTTIMLTSLDEASTERLVAGILTGPIDSASGISELIFRKARGNPLLSIAILKHLLENGSITGEKGSWHITKDEHPELPHSIVDIIMERARALSGMERDIIACAAVIGREFSFDLLYRLSDLSREEIVDIVDKARTLHIFEDTSSGGETIAFAHDRIMESFAEIIGPENRRNLHHKIACALESQGDFESAGGIFDIAHHFIEAGDRKKSIEYAFPAAMKAMENHAYGEALRYLKKTVGMLIENGEEESNLYIDCAMELGEIYATTGEYERAIETLREILPRIKGRSSESQAYFIICNAYYRKGDWVKCEEYAAAGLALLGDTLPRTSFVVSIATILELLTHLIHRVLPGIFVRKRPARKNERYRHIIRFYEPLSMSYALNSTLKLVRATLRALNMAERRIGPSPELAMSLYAFGSICMAIPRFGLAKKYLEKALVMNTGLRFEWGRAKNLELMGYLLEWQGDYSGAAEYFTKSAEAFTHLGDAKELAMTINGLQHCRYYAGKYKEALETNDQYYQLADRLSDSYSVSAAEIYYSQYYRETGDLDTAQRHAQTAADLSEEKSIPFNLCSALNELGCHALESGDHSRAVELLEKAREYHEQKGFLKQYIVPVYINLAQARLDEYLAAEHGMPPGERRRKLRALNGYCRRALKFTKNWPTHYAGALRVMGCFLSSTGRHRRSDEFFTRSIAHARSHGRRFEEMRTLYDHGLSLIERGETGKAREKIEAAYQICVETGAGLYARRTGSILGIKEGIAKDTPIERLLIKERSESLRMFIGKIKTISALQELLDEVISRAVELSGAQRGMLYLESDKNGKIELRASRNHIPGEPVKPPYEIIERVMSTQRHVIARDPISGIPSSICVPMMSRYRLIGVCCFDAPLSQGLFSDSDGDFLREFLGEAGIAVENALLHDRMAWSGKNRTARESDREIITPATENKIKKAITYIEENYGSDISREGLAASLGINPDHLGKAFKNFTGVRISDYINRLRIDEASRKLLESDEKIIEIAYSVGFESLSTFNRAFIKEKSIPPQVFRKQKSEKKD